MRRSSSDVKSCQEVPGNLSNFMYFSTGGANVTTPRTIFDPTNVHYLVYCKENLPKIKLVRPRLEDEEEREMEEKYQNEEDN